MDFLEAVKALRDGECKRIQCETGGMLELCNGKIVPTAPCREDRMPSLPPTAYLGEWTPIGTKSATMETEVECWHIYTAEGSLLGTSPDEPNGLKNGCRAVRLTGTLTVDVPRKERKRWVMEDCGFILDTETGGVRYNRLRPFTSAVPSGKNGRLVYEYED